MYCCGDSWFTFKTSANPWLTQEERESTELRFVVSSKGSETIATEQVQWVLPMHLCSAAWWAAQVYQKLTAAMQMGVVQDEHGDMLLLDAQEGYEHLWRKVGLLTQDN